MDVAQRDWSKRKGRNSLTEGSGEAKRGRRKFGKSSVERMYQLTKADAREGYLADSPLRDRYWLEGEKLRKASLKVRRWEERRAKNGERKRKSETELEKEKKDSVKTKEVR